MIFPALLSLEMAGLLGTIAAQEPSAPAAAPAPFSVAAEQKFKLRDEWIYFKVDSPTPVKFVVMDDGVPLGPLPPWAPPPANTFAARALKPCKFRVLCYTGGPAGPSEPAVVTVTVEGEGRPDVGPDVGDPLTAKFQGLYRDDAGQPDVKRSMLNVLKGIWKAAARRAADKALATTQDLLDAVRSAAADEGLDDNSLSSLRRGIANELVGRLPTSPSEPLSDDTRAKAAAAFAAVAQALSAVKE